MKLLEKQKMRANYKVICPDDGDTWEDEDIFETWELREEGFQAAAKIWATADAESDGYERCGNYNEGEFATVEVKNCNTGEIRTVIIRWYSQRVVEFTTLTPEEKKLEEERTNKWLEEQKRKLFEASRKHIDKK